MKYPTLPAKKTAIAFAIANALVVSSSEAAFIFVSGGCTLNEAIISANNDNAANNGCADGSGADTIVLTNDVSFFTGFENGANNPFTATPFITSDITIDGRGFSVARIPTTPNKFRLFALTSANAKLSLDNVTVRGGNLPFGGGGIYVGGGSTLNANNTTIISNSATQGSGGGILSLGGTVSLQNSLLRFNSADENGGGFAGLRQSSSPFSRPKLSLQDSIVSDNSANSGGGVFQSAQQSASDLTIVGSSLIRNSAALQGGGLRTSRFTIEDSDISDNLASSGGGIFSLFGGGTISDSSISGNEALTSLPPGSSPYLLCNDDQAQPPLNWPGYGGGILSRSSPVTLLNTSVSGNKADCGGGIAATINFNVAFTGSVITNNTARDGGGMFLTSYPISGTTSARINGGSFSNNYARFGGGIHARNTRLSLLNMTLHNNSAFNGGGIRTDKSADILRADDELELNLYNVTVSGNTAELIGGGIQTRDTEATMYNTTIAFNQSTFERDNPGNVNGGGGIRVDVGTRRGSLKMRNTIISGSVGSDCLDSSFYGVIANEDIDASNIIEDNSCNTAAMAVVPRLQPLSDNGGQNQTHELLQSSPALDAGDNAVCLAAPINGLDQRGIERPNGSTCDIGAVESRFIADDGRLIVIPLPNGKSVVVPL